MKLKENRECISTVSINRSIVVAVTGVGSVNVEEHIFTFG